MLTRQFIRGEQHFGQPGPDLNDLWAEGLSLTEFGFLVKARDERRGVRKLRGFLARCQCFPMHLS